MVLSFDRDAIEDLIFLAKQDIIEQRYKEYSKILKNDL